MSSEPRLIGYARVSTDDQDFAPQIDLLVKAGVPETHIYREHASGALMRTKALSGALRAVHPGDTLVVCKLDRLARSMKRLIEISEYLEDEEVHLRVLQDGIDTTTLGGKLVFHIIGAMAEFERGQISERTKVAMRYKKSIDPNWKPGPKSSIASRPLRIAKWLELERDGLVQREGQDKMFAADVVAELNAADPKWRKIGHPNTYRTWKRNGCHGLEAVEEFAEEPLELDE